MQKKTLKTKPTLTDDATFTDEAATRWATESAMRDRALLALVAEETMTLRAQRLEALASACQAIKTLGGFPAIELIFNSTLNELTVLARELHEARIARGQS